MNTIVVNLKNGAVTEYTNHDFDSVTPTHAGSALGLYAFGGDKDVAAPIVGTFKTGKGLWDSTLKKMVDLVFLSIQTSRAGRVLIDGQTASYSYPFTVDPGGESRCKTGRGIRETYLAIGYTNPDGADFQVDRFEVNVTPSRARRTQ